MQHLLLASPSHLPKYTQAPFSSKSFLSFFFFLNNVKMSREGLNQRPPPGARLGGRGDARWGAQVPEASGSHEARRDLCCARGSGPKSSVQFQEVWLSSAGASRLMWLRGGQGDQGGQGTHLGGWVEGLDLLFGTWWRRGRAQPQAPPQRLCQCRGQWLHHPHKILLANLLLGVQRGWVSGESVLHGA